MKKILTLGTIAITTLPLTAVIACGKDSESAIAKKIAHNSNVVIEIKNDNLKSNGEIKWDELKARADIRDGDEVSVKLGDNIGYAILSPNLVIPNWVTKIPDNAFNKVDIITSITLPDTITSIGKAAFSKAKITSLILPNSLKTIGDQAFEAAQLTSLEVPKNVESIGESAFVASRLTSLILNYGIKTIGKEAFGNHHLASLVMPNSITEIGAYSFAGEHSNLALTLSNSLKEIPEGAFANSKIEHFNIPDSIEVIGEGIAIAYNIKWPINSHIKTIGENAFDYIKSDSIEIPNGVKEIKWGAFRSQEWFNDYNNYGNYKNSRDKWLVDKSITIPNSIEIIGNEVFYVDSNTTIHLPAKFNNQTDIERIFNFINLNEKYTDIKFISNPSK